MSKTATKPNFAPEASSPPPIVMRAIETLYLASEAPKGANLVVRDSSRGSPMTDAELEASIYAKGIIQPLIWKSHQGKDYVVAGNRRLRLLRKIFADAPASLVQTQNVDLFGGDWREIAGDTNLSLPPHMVERYELIVKLAADLHLSPADTQARFGMSQQQYGRVMALGKMSPVVRQAWKDAVIDAKTAQAFTLESDPKEQERIFAAISKSGRVSEWEVKRKIVPQTQQETGKLVAFVGLDTVRNAKLLKQEDMFATDSSSNHIVTDTKALNKLVGDKLAAKCKGLVEAGWKWAIPEDKVDGSIYHYGTIEPKKVTPTAEEKSRMKQIHDLLYGDRDNDDQEYDDEPLMEEQERIEQAIALRGYTAEQMKKGGCILKIARDGKLTIEYGRIKPAEKQSVAASERGAKKAAKPKKPGVVTLTNAGVERLSEQLEKAVAFSLSATPHVAVAALIAGFASDGHVVNVNVGGAGRTVSYGRNSGSRNADEKNFAQVFEGAVKATAESRVVMLTKIVAEAVAIQIRHVDAKPPIDDKGLQALVAKMDPKMLNAAIANTFDAKSYFDGVNLQACVDAVRCSMGDDHANKIAKMKKGEAAKFATANVPTKGWLPKELRTVHYKGPVESTPAAKPKAPAKKAAAGKEKAPAKKRPGKANKKK